MNILYVENQMVFAENVKQQFLSRHSVIIVPSLSAARQMLQSGSPFDLVLVDYDLDDGKGDELVRTLRLSGNPPVIIAVSSHDEGNAALTRAGAAAVCSKMEFDKIQAVIDRLTQSSSKDKERD
jgi:CheY-like chemotaxis protein